MAMMDLAEPELEKELQSTHDRLIAIQRQEAAASNKIKDINKQVKNLLKDRKSIVRQRSGWKNSFEADVLPYSKAWNLSFSRAMQNRLPRELRDMIYKYIWDSPTLNAMYAPMMFTKNDRPENFTTAFAQSHVQNKPHFIQTTFMGAETAQEVVHAWYTAMSADDAYGFPSIDWSDVEHAICHDAFHVGLTGANVLRELNIAFDMDDFESLRSGEEMRYDTEVQNALEKLLLIENKAGFDLGIKISQRKIQLNTWLHAFVQLKPILETFEKEGADVRIFWMYDVDHEHVDVECNELIRNHDPDWKKDIITFLDIPEIEERHKLYKFEDDPGFDPEDYSSPDEDEDDEEDGLGSDWEDVYDDDPSRLYGAPCDCQRCFMLAY